MTRATTAPRLLIDPEEEEEGVFINLLTEGDIYFAARLLSIKGPDLLYIIHGNGNFSQAVTDYSFPWF